MAWKKIVTIGLWVGIWLFIPLALQAQTANILLEGDIRIFTTLAALRVAGYNPPGSNSVGRNILQEFNQIPPELVQKLQTYYQIHAKDQKPEEFLTPYLSLALLSEGPPDFRLSIPLTNLPPDAKSVYEFLTLIRNFYQAGKVEVVWSGFRTEYDKAILKTRPYIENLIMLTNGYLRIASYTYLDRRLFFIPEFLLPPNTLDARNYQDIYYLVFNPTDPFKMEDVRHQYLHFLLDPFALRYSLTKDVRLELVKFLETLPPIQERYRNDLQFIVVESLIRALELRMNKVSEPKLSENLTQYIKEGAIFAQFFYSGLQGFEKNPEGIRVFYPDLVKNIEFTKIKENYVTAQNAPVVKAIELGEIEKLLKKANLSIANEDLSNAQDLYQTILQQHDPNYGEALYGLGVIAIMQKENQKESRQTAMGYFQKAIISPTCPPSSKVWAHIYLGRIYDVEKKRAEAVQEYEAAVALGDNARDAQEVAKKGIQEAFGSKKP
jgi:tetratricopeptide (TPR) repeat protein